MTARHSGEAAGLKAVSRRVFLEIAVLGAAGVALGCGPGAEESKSWIGLPKASFAADPQLPVVRFLSWDTEGGDRAVTNLLRSIPGLSLRLKVAGVWTDAASYPTVTDSPDPQTVSFRVSVAGDADLLWSTRVVGGGLSLSIRGEGGGIGRVEDAQIFFPFDPRITATTILPAVWNEDGTIRLPAVLSAPDFGQMLLCDPAQPNLTASLEGNRDQLTADLTLDLPSIGQGEAYNLSLMPVRLAAPEGLADTSLWPAVRRGWFNAWQLSSHWGDQNSSFRSSPAGLFANNVISDPVSSAVPIYADLASWTPEIAPGISMMPLVRKTIEWWLDNRLLPSGEVLGYWNFGNFLDANPGILIAAWAYMEATQDQRWLAGRIQSLEFVSDFIAQRDVDGDGIVEATQSGNYGSFPQPPNGRSSCCQFDATNYGGKDGYSNAVIYRGWCCLADLEARLGRSQQQMKYAGLAARLRAAYSGTFFNAQTGWLAMWKSADGMLHDYASPIVNGIAIEYQLVDSATAQAILLHLWNEIRKVGFARFDLGIPCVLHPIPRDDYPSFDGNFPRYQDGGVMAGLTLHFLAAHYVLGQTQNAEMILRAMLDRQTKIGFQNGVTNRFYDGLEWTTWDGKPTGYEGYLADVYFFFLAVLLREPAFRARYYRPLTSI